MNGWRMIAGMGMSVEHGLITALFAAVIACSSKSGSEHSNDGGAQPGDESSSSGRRSDAGAASNAASAGQRSDGGGAGAESGDGSSAGSDADGGTDDGQGGAARGGTTSNPGGSAGSSGEAGGSGGASGSKGGTAGASNRHTLRIEFVGDVKGTVKDRLSTFTCQDDCERTIPEDYEDTYRALPLNGTATYFAGFGGDCQGLAECHLVMDEDKRVTVEFRKQTHNFVFLSSTAPSNSRGGAMRYDEDCNTLAKAAGINNASGDAYVAWVSDKNSLALTRLGTTARGWVRLDGKPVADTIEGLFAGEIFHTIRVDDKGVVHDNETVRTGTLADGSAAPDNCSNFTSDSGGWDLSYGANYGGPSYWTAAGTRSCNIGMRVYCFGTALSEPIALTREQGKLIYLSEPFRPNTTTSPDEACAESAPSGVGGVRAMVTYDGVPGSEPLSDSTLYVRPDGQAVGLGADIVEASAPGVQGTVDDYLRTGIWQAGDGRYLDEGDSLVWVGDINITRGVGTGACKDWTVPGPGSATVGDYRASNKHFWNLEYANPSRSCDNSYRFYCVEQ